MVVVHREGRKAKVPLGGTRQILDPGVVKRGCEELGLDGFSSNSLRKNLEVEPLLGSSRFGSGGVFGFSAWPWCSAGALAYAASNLGMRIRL